MPLTNVKPRNTMRFLIILEAIVFGSSVYIAVALRFTGEDGEIAQIVSSNISFIWSNMMVNTSIMLLSMTAMGLYEIRSREEPIGMFVRVLAAFFLGGIISIVLFYILPSLYFGRGVFALTNLFSLLAIGTIRPLYFQFLDSHSHGLNVLVLGAGKMASYIPLRLRRRVDRRGIAYRSL